MTPAVIIIDKYSKYIYAHMIKEAAVFGRPAYLHDTGCDHICMTPAVIIIDKYSKCIHAHMIKEAAVFGRPAYLHDIGHDYHRQIS